MQLTEKQLEIINAYGHLLVTGGPGSGKTTVSIFKAAHIAARALHPGQKILFLSFARPTISRVIEAIEYEQQIPCEQKKRIEVETYHALSGCKKQGLGALLLADAIRRAHASAS